MSAKGIMIGMAAILLLGAVETSSGTSIWAKRDKDRKTVYADDVARHIGDVLTIVISEDSKVDNTAKRDLQKDTAKTSTFDGSMGIDNILPKIPGFTMNGAGSDQMKSKADYKDERSYTDRVSAIVMDVLPNGNLMVVGSRDRQIGGDVQTIEVSGIVRPNDIGFDNTIKSQQVANFRIMSKNGGVSAPYTQTGWLGRIMDILWPW
jgi:flagellar L-ring protein precursor FlgH